MIYKASIALHFTPTKWKSSKVVYIPKIGKDDYALAKSYRPISLMNYLLKGLERLSVWVADKALEDNPIHIKQHGFQKGKSTESAISNTVHKIEKHILNGEHCMCVFLDIQAAFDSITPEHSRYISSLRLHNTRTHQKCPPQTWMSSGHGRLIL